MIRRLCFPLFHLCFPSQKAQIARRSDAIGAKCDQIGVESRLLRKKNGVGIGNDEIKLKKKKGIDVMMGWITWLAPSAFNLRRRRTTLPRIVRQKQRHTRTNRRMEEKQRWISQTLTSVVPFPTWCTLGSTSFEIFWENK